MSKHTLGPWSINNWPQPTSDIAIGAVGTPLIARVMLRDVSVNQQQANAHLIAAAPEIFDALRELTIAAESADWDIGDNASVLNAARAAIAKAEGGAP